MLGGLVMPRPRGIRKTIDEKIEEKELIISELSEKLAKEKEELKLLYDKQKEQKTSQILSLMTDNNLSIDDVKMIITNHISLQETTEKVG